MIGFAEKAAAFPDFQKAYYDDPDNIQKLAAYLELYKSVSPDNAAQLTIEGMKSLSEEDISTPAGWFMISNFPYVYIQG
ncbi:MAG: hypothetical protein IH947_08205 [Bacteroidetes bacterium]|nr:hypothetical protein [Bacteroidota bacterium]